MNTTGRAQDALKIQEGAGKLPEGGPLSIV